MEYIGMLYMVYIHMKVFGKHCMKKFSTLQNTTCVDHVAWALTFIYTLNISMTKTSVNTFESNQTIYVRQATQNACNNTQNLLL